MCKAHSGILGKGLALSHSPTILEALEGNLPLHLQTNEHSFLEDFITCVQNSSGGRLARLDFLFDRVQMTHSFMLCVVIPGRHYKFKRFPSLPLSLCTFFVTQVAAARLLCRSSEDISNPEQRWHTLWVANYCGGTDQRPVWRCGACSQHEGQCDCSGFSASYRNEKLFYECDAWLNCLILSHRLGGGEGCTCLAKEVNAGWECEEAAAASRRLLPLVLWTWPYIWRSANAQAGGHVRAHDRERSSLHCYNHDEGQPLPPGSSPVTNSSLHLDKCK